MPEEIAGHKRTAYNIGNQLGISTFSLKFKGDDGQVIDVNISYRAGKGAAIISMFMMIENIEIDKENESGFERSQTFDGQRTLSKYKSSEKYEKATLQYLLNQRFGIEATGQKMNPDELWNFLKKLDIEQLVP